MYQKNLNKRDIARGNKLDVTFRGSVFARGPDEVGVNKHSSQEG